MNLNEIIYDIVLEAYSKNILTKIVDKFEAEGASITEADVYSEYFYKWKDTLPPEERDIFKWSWNDLKSFIDTRLMKSDVKNVKSDSSAKKVYDQNGVQVYLGDSKEKCISLGTGYSFCISSRGIRNQYGRYRYMLDGTPYFIYNKNLPERDPYHILVIIAYRLNKDNYEHFIKRKDFVDVPPNFENKIFYGVSNALNNGETYYSIFENIKKDFNLDSGLNANLFLPVHLTYQEEEVQKLKKDYRKKISIELAYFENNLDNGMSSQSNLSNVLLSSVLKTAIDFIDFPESLLESIRNPNIVDWLQNVAKIEPKRVSLYLKDVNQDAYQEVLNKINHLFKDYVAKRGTTIAFFNR